MFVCFQVHSLTPSIKVAWYIHYRIVIVNRKIYLGIKTKIQGVKHDIG